MISEDSSPPVCKLVDFGQFKYQQQKKEKTAKKNSKGQTIKELKMSPKISTHDYQVRLKHAEGFLQKGFKVKAVVFFKGREFQHVELGMAVMTRYIEDLASVGQLDGQVTTANRLIVAIITPRCGQ